ncbi:MAG: GDSL-type esterase/lipase family protein [Acetobacteraceae bacterium]|nr:GDSL-type esterase/lipase family protein [Acetobacteraceae bacterium]
MKFSAAILGLVCLLSPLAKAACPVPPGALPAEAVPAPLPDPNWQARIAAIDSILGTTDLAKVHTVFLGDSITEAWAPPVFAHFNNYRAALNLGARGAGTQTLLWQMQRLPLGSKLNPSVIVLLIGTNNLWPGVQIKNVVTGISTVLAELRQRVPAAKIVLIDLLPRGESPNDPARAQVAEVNRGLAACADQTVSIVNPGPVLLDGRGYLSKDISYDGLHPSWLGYAIMGAAIEPTIRKAYGGP